MLSIYVLLANVNINNGGHEYHTWFWLSIVESRFPDIGESIWGWIMQKTNERKKNIRGGAEYLTWLLYMALFEVGTPTLIQKNSNNQSKLKEQGVSNFLGTELDWHNKSQGKLRKWSY